MTPKYSIVTTCKGRLHNLKRSLPEFLKQEHTEVIVVDYDCPDGTSDYVKRIHPDARVVFVANQSGFNLSHARNLGAAQARGEFLVFLDADVVIGRDFMKRVDSKMESGSFALFGPPAPNSLRGSCVVARREFMKIGGYDELLGASYDGEDLDIYMRLAFVGARRIHLEPAIVDEVIEQNFAERARFRDPELKKHFLKGQLYMSAKEMVMSVEGSPTLSFELRKRIYEEVCQNVAALYEGDKNFVLEVRLPDKYKRGFLQEWEFSRSILVRARRKTSS